MATSDNFRSLAYLFRVPPNSISVFLPEVLQAVHNALQDFVKVPSTEDEWMKVTHLFHRKWNFPKACGAVDGKHISIKKPPGTGSKYFNYKKFFSIILFSFVDAQYYFRYINVEASGNAGDAGIFRTSTLYKALEENLFNFPPNHMILGDEAFPSKTYLMKPYR